MLPDPSSVLANGGLELDHSAAASESLLADLRSDNGMEWVPERAWLTKIAIDASALDLRYDLAIDVSGAGRPSLQDAGFAPFGPLPAPPPATLMWVMLLAGALLLPVGGAWLIVVATRSGGRPLAS